MELILFASIFFIFGCIVGSFLNVVVDRGDTGKSAIFSRSQCDYCKESLAAQDLIPIFSYLLLRGRCRYCKKQLSFYYPLVELTTGILFALSFVWLINRFGAILELLANPISAFLILFIVSTLIIIFFADLKFGIIPFKTVLAGLIGTALLHLLYPTANVSLVNLVLTALGSFGSFLLIFLITRGKAMGFGDVVFVFLMGFLLGFPKIILGFYVAFVGGAIISLAVLKIKRKKIKGAVIPFGPFLVSGTIISLFWGEFLIDKILTYLLG